MSPDAEQNSDIESKAETDDKTDKSSPSTKDTGTKRRTKTGCLTCRRRRIKCGEERPVCKNCVKSKRDCAGYNQPLIYRQHGQASTQPLHYAATATNYLYPESRTHATNPSTTNITSLQPLSYAVLDHNGGLPAEEALWPVSGDDRELQISGIRFPGSTFEPSTSSLPSLPHQNFGIPISGVSYLNQTMNVPHLETLHSQMLESNATIVNSSYSHEYTTPDSEVNRYSNFGFVQRPSFSNYLQPKTSIVPEVNHGTILQGIADDPDDPWDVDMDDDHAHFDFKHDSRDIHGSSTELRPSLTSPSIVRPLSTNSAAQSWRQSPVASPMLDEKSQHLLAHFISVTGPCMGTYDKHETTTNLSIPKMIWTHGLPAMAFSSPALAHAILAVSAMHMTSLNLGRETTAVKHFTHALQRVGKSLATPDQRHQVATLATVLLLGYYEVMAGDHSRWNLHLSGAGKLVMEHDYAGMIRTVRRMRTRRRYSIAATTEPEHTKNHQPYFQASETASLKLEDDDWKIDQDLISKLMGCDVNYDTQVQSNFKSAPATIDLNAESLNDWKNLMELYWFYCRQDVFMSMLSGDPLLLPYSQWKYCPPRGSLGNSERVNTTFDHLWLIVARLTDFGGKDRKRKQRVVNAQGGHWIPPPGFLPNTGVPGPTDVQLSPSTNQSQSPTRPNANEGRARVTKQGPYQPPPQPSFYGMLPTSKGPIQMPDSFRVMKAELKGGPTLSPIDAESPQGPDLETQTKNALEEHVAISKAFDLFESLLGPDFQPLPPDDIQITTPFGHALRYRSPTIAVMWTFLLTGRILLRRLHPYSPPAAMVSAGVNARFTHEYAKTIGRICGGLYAQHSYFLQAGYVDHILSAAVIETTFTILFAGVQFQDPIQRGWTISKLSEIAKVTGWQTSAAVAAACEAAWEQSGMAGKGPVYERTMDQNNDDVRLNGKWKTNSSHDVGGGDGGTSLNAMEEYQSRFVSHDRDLIDKHASTRAHWALGLLSLEDDMERIARKDDE